ncbi:hypothetical protein GOP47_0012729 [Adiantum capillus-veneris]|uniref:Uncharacterized protein n=1 Tax=Adiantum capillus-veneris TaxID=13818 RepID=A0A9D4ZEK7_ADICA|nr:hypothetical protein GOP47_0012729 [Adiantum capillus-veneris]
MHAVSLPSSASNSSSSLFILYIALFIKMWHSTSSACSLDNIHSAFTLHRQECHHCSGSVQRVKERSPCHICPALNSHDLFCIMTMLDNLKGILEGVLGAHVDSGRGDEGVLPQFHLAKLLHDMGVLCISMVLGPVERPMKDNFLFHAFSHLNWWKIAAGVTLYLTIHTTAADSVRKLSREGGTDDIIKQVEIGEPSILPH